MQPQSSAQTPIRLSELKLGQTARFHDATLAPQDTALLGAIGLTGRRLIRMCQAGEPYIVQVQTTRIGLSRQVAEGIFVIPELT